VNKVISVNQVAKDFAEATNKAAKALPKSKRKKFIEAVVNSLATDLMKSHPKP